jgi:hypothetical protein
MIELARLVAIGRFERSRDDRLAHCVTARLEGRGMFLAR